MNRPIRRGLRRTSAVARAAGTTAWLVFVATAAGAGPAGVPGEPTGTGTTGTTGTAATAGVLRVGTSGDYAPFSVRRGFLVEGFDLDVARAFVEAHGRTLRAVTFRWPELVADLRAGHFDVAMSGVTVRPERSLAGRFSVPVVESGALVLVPAGAPFRDRSDLDAPEVTLAVNAGGHLERVARRLFPRAAVRAIADNERVVDELLAGRADAVVTDTLEAPHWRRRAPDVRAIGPLTRDRKAYLVAPDRPDLARELDLWLLAREADGTLAALRRRHLGIAAEGAPAEPLAALVAAMDERLALMPLVAESKRASGGPVRVPEREAEVIEAAVAAVDDAASRLRRPAPPRDAVAALFEAQMAAARAVQEAVLAAAAPKPAAGPVALGELRGALERIGERQARLLVLLPRDLDPAAVAQELSAGLAAVALPGTVRERLADAILGLPHAGPAPSRSSGLEVDRAGFGGPVR